MTEQRTSILMRFRLERKTSGLKSNNYKLTSFNVAVGGKMEIIDFARAREERLANIAKAKAEPRARYTAMLEALYKEDLTSMEYIAQIHALHMAYKIVENSPHWGDRQGDFFLQTWSALEVVVPIIGDLIIANSYVDGSVHLTGQRFTVNEVGPWAARRMILDYLLILIDDNSRPDDWLDIRDKEPMKNIFAHLGYEL